MGWIGINRLDIPLRSNLAPAWGFLLIKKEEEIVLPSDTEATAGEHDYKSCETCTENLENFIRQLTEKFDGTADRKGFPHCCDRHAKLTKVNGFRRSLFRKAIRSTALKIIYTHQHIINHFADEHWEKTIRDYIVYTADSFGAMPEGCGNPLFIDSYYHFILSDVKERHHIPEAKRTRITKLIEAIFLSESGSTVEDINILFKTYAKWQDSFPFALKSYFEKQRSTFLNRVPFFKGEVELNMFNGKEYALTHNRETLVEHLCLTTNKLLSEVDTHRMVRDGLIADINMHQFEIAGAKLHIQNDANLKDFSAKEKEYAQTIRQWLADQQEYFNAIAPLLQASSKKKEEKGFEDFLNGSKQSKEALIKELTPLFKNAKGKRAATILLALHRLAKLTLTERGKQELYDAINTQFGLALKNQSYQPYIHFNGNGVSHQRIADAEITDMMKRLE